MRIPLTKYGWPQVAVLPAMLLAVMIVVLLEGRQFTSPGVIALIEPVLGAVLFWTLAFFRDPERQIPGRTDILLAPADGKITDIETVNEDDFVGGPAIRIGIFLSLFDAHINRSPCNTVVKKVTYKKGKFQNAMNPHSGRVNESNDLYLQRIDPPADRLIVRQISGAIARRIVCETGAGQSLEAGQKFGMIKFGSRTELYIPASENIKLLAVVGDKVKAGLTPVLRYEESNTQTIA